MRPAVAWRSSCGLGVARSGCRLLSCYRSLGVATNASPEELKGAYYAAALRFHPDLNPEADAQQFARIATAFDTLSCPAKRKQYDTEHGIDNHSNLYESGSNAETQAATLREEQEQAAEHRLQQARHAARGGDLGKRRSRRRSSRADGDWWDVPNMRGVHDAGYGYTANLESALFGQFKLDERWDHGTALPTGLSDTNSERTGNDDRLGDAQIQRCHDSG